MIVIPDGLRKMRPPVPERSVGPLPGWRSSLDEEFRAAEPGQRGPAAVDPGRWRLPSGVGTGHEAVGPGLRLHVTQNQGASAWMADGITQAGPGDTAHAGYGEFHVQARVRYSTSAMRGIGARLAMVPARDAALAGWSLLETPGGSGSIWAATVPGRAGSVSRAEVPCDLTRWHVVDARRTFRRIAGQTTATCRLWIDGTEYSRKDAAWVDNPSNREPLVFLASGVVYPNGDRWHGPAVDASTPRDSWLELASVRIWAPG